MWVGGWEAHLERNEDYSKVQAHTNMTVGSNSVFFFFGGGGGR